MKAVVNATLYDTMRAEKLHTATHGISDGYGKRGVETKTLYVGASGKHFFHVEEEWWTEPILGWWGKKKHCASYSKIKPADVDEAHRWLIASGGDPSRLESAVTLA